MDKRLGMDKSTIYYYFEDKNQFKGATGKAAERVAGRVAGLSGCEAAVFYKIKRGEEEGI